MYVLRVMLLANLLRVSSTYLMFLLFDLARRRGYSCIVIVKLIILCIVRIIFYAIFAYSPGPCQLFGSDLPAYDSWFF